MSRTHDLLTDQGACTHQHFDAEFDDGDPENGPGTWGCDEFDVYTSESHDLIFQRGKWVDTVLIDWDMVRYCDEMERAYQ